MLDGLLRRLIDPVLARLGRRLVAAGVQADQVTVPVSSSASPAPARSSWARISRRSPFLPRAGWRTGSTEPWRAFGDRRIAAASSISPSTSSSTAPSRSPSPCAILPPMRCQRLCCSLPSTPTAHPFSPSPLSPPSVGCRRGARRKIALFHGGPDGGLRNDRLLRSLHPGTGLVPRPGAVLCAPVLCHMSIAADAGLSRFRRL